MSWPDTTCLEEPPPAPSTLTAESGYAARDPQEKPAPSKGLGEVRGGGAGLLREGLAVTEQGHPSGTCRVTSCAWETTDTALHSVYPGWGRRGGQHGMTRESSL